MELINKFLLLLISSSLLSFSSEAICVPRNVSGTVASISAPSPAATPARSVPSLLPPAFPPSGPKSLIVPVVNPGLNQICNVTTYPEVCIATFSPLLPSPADPVKVLTIGIQIIHKSFSVALATIKSISTNPLLTPISKSCLDTCLDTYDSAVTDMEDALKAIVSHDIGTLQSMLSAAISYVDTCESCFTDDAGIEPPTVVKSMDDNLNQLASNNMAISTLLKWK